MKIIIAAGGTGGHLFPGIALAEEFITKNETNKVLFIGTTRGMEKSILSREGFNFEAIESSGLKGKNPFNLLKSLFLIPQSIFQSIMIIKRFNPDLVIGLGGYVSGPVVLAAYLMGIKTAIHEQNTLPGFANRMLGKIVPLIFVSFEYTLSCFPKSKAKMLGNPIRKQCLKRIVPSSSQPPFTLLIVGGSLGSHQINSAVIDALNHLLPIRDKIKIIHQTGESDLKSVKEAYQSKGFSAEVVTFIDQIDSAYQQANLIICRAGATTLAELMVHHRASILIPYPLAADHHQHLNAKVLVSQHATQMIDPDQLTGKRLAEFVLQLYHHPEQLSQMENNAGKMGRPRAAQEIVDYCYKLIA
jgi:UDP-N-acetylglucosamine--N-acetylmuramyl-(pentapeptide) pyrophosphoryl-undecaprenol N-acetylglucosamine transferase